MFKKHSDNKPLVDKVDKEKELYDAIEKGTLDKIKDLIVNQRCNPDCRYAQGMTPLHMATLLNKPDVVALLLELGANLDKVATLNHSGKIAHKNYITAPLIMYATPLHAAVIVNSKEIATLLLAAGADYKVEALLEYNDQSNSSYREPVSAANLATHYKHYDVADIIHEKSQAQRQSNEKLIIQVKELTAEVKQLKQLIEKLTSQPVPKVSTDDRSVQSTLSTPGFFNP